MEDKPFYDYLIYTIYLSMVCEERIHKRDRVANVLVIWSLQVQS